MSSLDAGRQAERGRASKSCVHSPVSQASWSRAGLPTGTVHNQALACQLWPMGGRGMPFPLAHNCKSCVQQQYRSFLLPFCHV